MKHISRFDENITVEDLVLLSYYYSYSSNVDSKKFEYIFGGRWLGEIVNNTDFVITTESERREIYKYCKLLLNKINEEKNKEKKKSIIKTIKETNDRLSNLPNLLELEDLFIDIIDDNKGKIEFNYYIKAETLFPVKITRKELDIEFEIKDDDLYTELKIDEFFDGLKNRIQSYFGNKSSVEYLPKGFSSKGKQRFETKVRIKISEL